MLVITRKNISLQSVFHNIRFKVNRGAAAPHFLFIYPPLPYLVKNRHYMLQPYSRTMPETLFHAVVF